MLRPGAHGPLLRPRDKPGLVLLVPHRASLSDEFCDHLGQQARNPPVTHDRCTRPVPHHTTMINDHGLDRSPPTVQLRHEGADPVRKGWPWSLPLEDGVLLLRTGEPA